MNEVVQNEKKNKILSGCNSTTKLIMIYGIACGMKHLHSHGILHRNLLLARVYLTENFRAKTLYFWNFHTSSYSKNIDVNQNLESKY